MIFNSPIVGAYFRKPAPAILANLPAGAALHVEAEPDNEYDPNAVAVYIYTQGMRNYLTESWEKSFADSEMDEGPLTQIEAACAAQGCVPNELWAPARWHLGYICNSEKTGGKKANELLPLLPKVTSAELYFDVKGKPWVKIALED